MSDNPNPRATFKEHYTTLKMIADKLQDANQEPDIDELVEDVKKATTAYQSCKERLSAAKEVLESHLSKVEKADDGIIANRKDLTF